MPILYRKAFRRKGFCRRAPHKEIRRMLQESGHLFELCPPSFYDKKFESWNVADLPIIPGSSATKRFQRRQNRQRIPTPYPTSTNAENVFSIIPGNFFTAYMDKYKYTIRKQ